MSELNNINKKTIGGIERIFTDKDFDNPYKKIFNSLFKIIKVNEDKGSYPIFRISSNIPYEKAKMKNFDDKPHTLTLGNNGINFELKSFYFSKEISNVKSIDDEIVKQNEDSLFSIMVESAYLSLLKDFMYNNQNKFNKISLYSNDTLRRIIDISSDLVIKPSHIVMNEESALRLWNNKEIKEFVLKSSHGMINHEKNLTSLLGIQAIVLKDPDNVLENKIFIIHKSNNEYSDNTALMAFLYHDPKIGYINGEYVKTWSYDKALDEGVNGNPNKADIRVNCSFNLLADLHIINNDLIRVLNISSF